VNQVDHLILQRQLAAVATANVKVELVESTRGQFVFNGQRIVDFDVSGQQLRDGRFIAAAPQAANAGSPGR
jgi:hypothetical protein